MKKLPFRPTLIAAATAIASGQVAQAGPGFGDTLDLAKTPFIIQSYFASSPAGDRLWTGVNADGSSTGTADPLLGAPDGYDPANRAAYAAAVKALYPNGYPGTGKALRKFVDPLPGLGKSNTTLKDDPTASKYIPVAVASKWINPQGNVTGDDYFEIAAVEYSEKFHSDLPKATTLRGYVQIDQYKTHGFTTGKPATWVSNEVPLTYPNGLPIMVNQTDANGKLLKDANGKTIPVQAYAVDKPHYLGPAVVATKGTPTRYKFHNLLPVGRANTTAETRLEYKGGAWTPVTGLGVAKDAAGNLQRNGDLFLPVDPSIVGAGLGPDGLTEYTQNRISVHLHGGDTPWISDGTPHQWFTPAGEADPGISGSLASDTNLDPTLLPEFLRGASYQNVPDMNDPGAGAQTLYFPNGQSGRLLWYHDHALGITRVNVMAGMAAPYVLTDSIENALVNGGTATAQDGSTVTLAKVLPDAAHTIPLVLQDKTFVPQDIALQDARWSTTGWGQPGDIWYPHVYETVQDPNQDTHFNAVGRWHWGPWFWPVFPALYQLPTGSYGDVTTVPEAWGDTPVVNGVAYPTVTVDAAPYRLRLLNASNDRFWTFNLFEADPSVTGPGGLTEMKMLTASELLARPTCAPGETKSTGGCRPEGWATDVYGHNGGFPDPTLQGPTLYQIASEGGLLPGVAKKDAAPISYLLDKGRAAVLNVDYATSGLQLGNAERADVVVDFTCYAGKTLLVYNDGGAPVPAADPRNEYFTGYGDNSATGGAEDTRPGYGPNTRTLMQIKVNGTPSAACTGALEGNATAEAALDTNLKAAFKASQETPIVAQSAYNGALGTTWSDTFGSIYSGSLKEPTFNFTQGTANTDGHINAITMTSQGDGYIASPKVVIAPPASGTPATAEATLKISQLNVLNGGGGYKIAPLVTITSLGTGGGAAATATLKVTNVVVNTQGNYAVAPTVTFSPPQTAGGVQALGTVVMTGTKVTGVTITNPGSGYTAAPSITFNGTGTKAVATAYGSVDALKLDIPDPTNPGTAGGAGYDNLLTAAAIAAGTPGTAGLTITITAPTAGSPGAATATAGAIGKVFDITLTNSGKGYSSASAPAVTVDPPAIGNNLAVAAADVSATNGTGSILVKSKAIQELFEPTYGRLNATLGVEIPFTSALTQTTIPLGYVDAATEKFGDGEVQIWKITHNGVDTHPVHFHLLNVQLISRIGWDNFVTPPEPNELGWKETVKMSPLEDVIVAVRAKKMPLNGFGVPQSVRPQDPSQPLGQTFGFTQVDPNTGNPAPMANDLANYDNEYVWHCHILGHEENDFMRPVVFHPRETTTASNAPILGAVTSSAGVPQLTWTDKSTNEYRFDILRASQSVDANGPVVDASGKPVFDAPTVVDTVPANSSSYVDASAPPAGNYEYCVAAVVAAPTANDVFNTSVSLQSACSALLVGDVAPVAPSALVFTNVTDASLTASWTDNSLNETSFLLERCQGDAVACSSASATWTQAASVGANVTTAADSALTQNTTYTYRLSAVNAQGASAYVTGTVTTGYAAAVAPAALTATPAATSVTLSWTNSAPQTGITVSCVGTGCPAQSVTLPAGTPSYTFSGLNPITNYTFTVTSVNGPVQQASASVTTKTLDVIPAAVTGLTAVSANPWAVSATSAPVNLSWIDNATNETGVKVFRCAGATCAATGTPLTTTAANATSFADNTTVPGTQYTYAVVATNAIGDSTPVATATITTPIYVGAPSNLARSAQSTSRQVILTWTDNATNESQFVIERSTNNGAFVQVGLAGVNATTFTDSTVVAGNTYTYRVKAENTTAGVTTPSAWSAPVLTVVNGVIVAAPSNATASVVGATSVRVRWTDNSNNETSFIIERSVDGVTWVQIGTAARNGTSFTDATAVAGTTYSYRVTAQNVGTVTTLSAPSNVATVSMAVPAAPSNVQAVAGAVGSRSITVSWTDNANNETGFTIQRQTMNTNGTWPTTWQNVGNVGANVVTFTDTGRTAGRTYRYQVRSTNAVGNSAYVGSPTTGVVAQ